MNRTFTVVAIVAVAVIAAAYFFLSSGIDEIENGRLAIQPAEMTEAEKAAADFCIEKGGKIETVVAAEGKTNLCALADGSKVEAGQYMLDNKTE